MSRLRVIIRSGHLSDHREIMQIERCSFQNPWSSQSVAGLLAASQSGHVLFHVALCNDRVVGYAVGEMAGPELHLTNLAVAATFRKQGIGSRLAASLEASGRKRGAEEVWLEVREHNKTALRFYHKHGYETRGCRIAYYRDPCEDALLMAKRLEMSKD